MLVLLMTKILFLTFWKTAIFVNFKCVAKGGKLTIELRLLKYSSIFNKTIREEVTP